MNRLLLVVLSACALIVAELHGASLPHRPAASLAQRVPLGAVAERTAALAVSSQLAGPSGLAASVTRNSVLLQWVAGATPVASYIVEVGSFPGDADLAVYDTGSTTTSLVAVDVPALNYWVRVRARSGNETSAPSNEVRVIVTAGPCFGTLYAPYRWRASGQGSSVALTWNTPPLGCPPTDYVIEAGSRSQAADLANFRTGSGATTYVATSVPPGTYYVRLRSAKSTDISFETEEHIVVVGSHVCVYSVSPSTLFISRGGLNGNITIGADAACPWTVSANVPWLFASTGALPVSGTGATSIDLPANVNFGNFRTGTVAVRWPGGAIDIPVTQNGFGLFPPF